MFTDTSPLARLFRLLVAVFVLNLLLVFTLWALRKLPPQHNVKLSSTPNSLLVFGKNRFGYFSIRQFSNWAELQSFLEKNNLKLPQITHTEIIKETEVEVQNRKVFWGRGEHRKILHTPDEISAHILSEQIVHIGLQPSNFGYSVLLKN